MPINDTNLNQFNYSKSKTIVINYGDVLRIFDKNSLII